MSSKSEKIETILSNFNTLRRTMIAGHINNSKNFGISFSQTHVLFMLKKKGQVTITELATCIGVSKSAATQIADGLVKQELITRTTDPQDRRVQRLRPSAKGTKHMETMKHSMLERFSTLFDVLNERELLQLETITSKLLKARKEDNK
ncbi:MAG: MarR family transcriptional regulator [bacterium]